MEELDKNDNGKVPGSTGDATLPGGEATYSYADRAPRGKLYATNWLADISQCSDFDAVQVVFKNTRSGFYSNPAHLDLKIGDVVAVEAAPGHDIGRVSMVGRLVRLQMKKAGIQPDAELKRVFRLASAADLEKFEEARSREHSTMIRARKIAEELGLNMKIGDVEYQGDGGKAIFYYIADERVDFRKLIRILADVFKVRIEMKQIGARQEAGRIGGIGPCGRPLCCSSWMTHFVSVGTGSARMQDLSMNPQKLAGQCAKLKCCLNFEIDSYAEANRKLPPKDAHLETKDNTYYYFKPDVLALTITYSTDKSIPANLVTVSAARAFEIIALNKRGIKPDSLEPDESKQPERKEYIDLVEQESLTRFDKSKNKKNKKKKAAADQQNAKPAPKPAAQAEEKGDKQNRPDRQPGKQSGKQPNQKPRSNHERQPDNRQRRQKQEKSERLPQNQKQQNQKTEQTPDRNGSDK